MISPEQELSIRQELVAGGLRTVGFAFDGCGDSGSLEGMRLPTDPALPLNHYLEEYSDLQSFEGPTTYECNENGIWSVVNHPAWENIQSLVNSISGAEDALDTWAYAALEHFDGDWINNGGGYGKVALDLVTGEFYIDGEQRVQSTESAISQGSLSTMEPFQQTLQIDSLIKRTLG